MTIVEAMSGQTGAHGSMEYVSQRLHILMRREQRFVVWGAGEIGLVMTESGVCANGCRSSSDVGRHAGFDPSRRLVQRTSETRNDLVHLGFSDDERRAEGDGILDGTDNKAVLVRLFE
jgi:hypothetical protein